MSPAEVIKAAKQDLAAYGLYTSFPVRIDWRGRHTQGAQGICYFEDKPPKIYVDPLLRGSALYRVVLHELGHALGLNDRRTGIMAARRHQPVDFSTEDPTSLQRRAWSYEIAEAVLKLRRKKVAA